MHIRAKHLRLDLALDFEKREVRGWVEHDLQQPGSAGDLLLLDSDGLEIERVSCGSQPREFELSERNPVEGSKLGIRLHEGDETIRVEYRSGTEASGLQWLSPEQTSGGRLPFVYSQGQTNHNRSWLPCQDDPAIRISYEATLRVPEGMRAVMAAQDDSTGSGDDGVFRFSMPQPVPSYLIALAAGDLCFLPMSERTGVWAEPGVVEAAAWEFADTEEIIQKTEAMYGPYRWGRYDLLILPPSFPLGGMENPRLTFATPTAIAGDRSLVSLIAHELAHSWSGNLVTNATWQDFWLNEGFTVYIERRVVEAVFGRERAEMEACIGRSRLEAEFARVGAGSRDTWLKGELRGRAPDASMSETPYEKGYLFLRHLENAFGRERFDAFLRGYFDCFAFQTMDTERFVEYLREELLSTDAEAANEVDVEAWIYAPDLPAESPRAHSSAFARVEEDMKLFLSGDDISARTDGWCTHEWVHFLRQLPRSLDAGQLERLGRGLGLDETGNGEIRCEWLRLCIEAGRGGIEDALFEFLGKVGRKKFVQPLLDALWAREERRPLAREIYRSARPIYHSMVRTSFDERLA